MSAQCNESQIKRVEKKRILLFGGTGSLGYKLVEKYLADHLIFNFSRDENKHWKMRLDFASHPDKANLQFIIGNVADRKRVKQAILSTKPNIIIIASAMKHIDQCEYNTHESIQTNLLGTKHILDIINEFNFDDRLPIETVVFVSSDKACSPINNYGMCKALSETLMIEQSLHPRSTKFVVVRYGNVLNSRGSIIPLLHHIGEDASKTQFTLTHRDMTRFVMTLEQSVELIDYAIQHGESGDTIIPTLVSMKVQDLLEIFSERYGKPVVETGLRPGEKMLESLINETQSKRIQRRGDYFHIKSIFTNFQNDEEARDYNSSINSLSKDELRVYLTNLNLI